MLAPGQQEEDKVPERSNPQNHRLTIYADDRAIGGLVIRYTETGLITRVNGIVPPHERLRFTLHLQSGIISGECESLTQDRNVCHLRFVALTPADRARLEPLVEAEE